jgi:hypothetical protein
MASDKSGADDAGADIGLRVIRSWTPEPKSLPTEVKTAEYLGRVDRVDCGDVEAAVPVPVPVVEEGGHGGSPWMTIVLWKKAVVLVGCV